MLARPYTVKATPVRGGEWRIEVVSGNGAVLLQSTERYATKGTCERAAEKFASAVFVFAKAPRENGVH